MNNSKLVSIIIPVYNAERYLKYCLESIVKQTYSNIEVLLIDDESEDQSGIICDNYSKKYSYIHTIHQKNKGCGFSRNTGLDKMHGEYYTFIDADDYVSIYYIEKMIMCIEKFNADMVTVGTIFMLETRNKKKNNDGSIDIFMRKDGNNFENKIKAPSWGKLYRTSTCGQIRYDRASYEDVPYAEFIRPFVNSVVEYNQSLYVYRAYQDSITRGGFGKKVLKKLHKEYGTINNSEWIKKAEKALDIVKYRGQEILYSSYLKRINKDILLLDNNFENDNSLIILNNEVLSKSKTNVIKFLTVKCKHIINLLVSKYKVMIKYNVKVD